jgi:hypothetical protein
MTKNENDNKISSRSCDILINRWGSAGLRAAIEAHDAGSQVLIVSKSRRGDPHTVLARGGINAALGTMDLQDNWMIHAADTLREGLFIGDYSKTEVLCKSAPDAVTELKFWRKKKRLRGETYYRWVTKGVCELTGFFFWGSLGVIHLLWNGTARASIIVKLLPHHINSPQKLP